MGIKRLEDLPQYGLQYFGIDEYERKQHVKQFSRVRWSYTEEMKDLATDLLEEYRHTSDKGIRYFNRDKEKYVNTIMVILSNCVDSIYSTRKHISISLDRSNYKNDRYNPVGLSYRVFVNVIEWMAKENYIDLGKASAGTYSEYQSEIMPLQKLKEAVEAYEITMSHTTYHREAEPVELRRAEHLVDYQRNTKRSNHDREVLRRYTNLLNDPKTKIKIGDRLVLEPVFMKSIYIDNFRKHGRIYGGAWQNCKAENRKSITINSKETVEVDIANCSLRMALHLSGEKAEGDLYIIKDYPRALVKSAINIMLNIEATSYARGVESTVKALLDDYSSYERQWIKQVVQDCYSHYSMIADDYFFLGRGLTLQNIDSEICLMVIKEFTEKSKVVLTVHDSFITCRDDEQKLRSCISLIYENIVGQKPILR